MSHHVYLPAICAFLRVCRCSLRRKSIPVVALSSCRSATTSSRRWCSAVSSPSTLPSPPVKVGPDGSLPRVTIAVGAAFGTSKAGIGISGIATLKPELIMKVRTEEIVKLARADRGDSAVTDSSRNVRYHCSLWAGSVRPDNWKSCVYPSPLTPPPRTNCRLFSRTVSPRVDYPLFYGFVHLGAGLACGFTGLSAGYAIGFVGDSVSRSVQYTPRSSLKMYHDSFLVCESICV